MWKTHFLFKSISNDWAYYYLISSLLQNKKWKWTIYISTQCQKDLFNSIFLYFVINFFKVEKGAHSMFIFAKSLLNKRFETHKMVIFIRISTLFESTLYFRQFDSRDHTKVIILFMVKPYYLCWIFHLANIDLGTPVNDYWLDYLYVKEMNLLKMLLLINVLIYFID